MYVVWLALTLFHPVCRCGLMFVEFVTGKIEKETKLALADVGPKHLSRWVVGCIS